MNRRVNKDSCDEEKSKVSVILSNYFDKKEILAIQYVYID
jgi:hypothetical protein